MAAWCAGEGDIVDANKATHDALIRILGPRRRGGITWRVYVDEGATAIVDRMLGVADSIELANYYRRIRALLREQGGCLVVASAPAVRT